MNRQLSKRIVLLTGLGVALINLIFVVTEQFWGLLIPFLLAIVALIFLALDKVLWFLVFATPLSIFYFNEDLHVGFTLPTEPLLFGVLLLFLFKIIYEGGFDLKVVSHPLSLAILINLFWVLVTSFTSEIPFVSFKFFLARLWFVGVYFYLLSQLFRRPVNIYRFLWLYLIPLAGVVIYTVAVHAQWGFTRDASVWVMYPFFKEHTVYGAVLALYLPASFALAFLLKQDLNQRFLAVLIFLILLVGVILSYTRAAWLSLIGAALAAILVAVHLRVWVFRLMVLAFLGLLYYYQADLMERFEKNESTSSDNLTEHVESISNISSDPSNMERINRWKSALRMFKERPVFGFGPGTYMFLYAPYQKPHEKTIISTNAGDLGNAHSEYLGPLAESGVVGLLSVLLVVYFTVTTGIRVYYRLPQPRLRLVALMLWAGLLTYWTHGFLNNFLDMDKAALPVYGFSAVLVVLDRHYPSRSG